MSTQITVHPPRPRCYKCGSANIEAVCHHCRRAMCALHIREPRSSSGRLISVEFTELGLKETCGEVPIHCEFCHHIVRPPHLVWVVVGVAILISALMLPSDVSGRSTYILLGGAIAVLGFYIYTTRTRNLIASRPPLPLLPHFNVVQILEIVRGRINLDSKGDYYISIPYAQGVFKLTANFGKAERDQLEQYQEKFNLAGNQDIRFNAGFVTLRSVSGIDYLENLPDGNNTVWALTGIQPFFENFERYTVGEWRKSRRYNLNRAAIARSFPIRIVPSLIQESAKRSLDLEIQWTAKSRGGNHLEIQKINRLELHVPTTWGQIQDAGGGMVSKPTNPENGNFVHTITWDGVLISESEQKKCQHTFSISFDKSIDESNSISGRLVTTFEGALSDVEGVSLFYPLGRHRSLASASIHTKLVIDFELNLAGLRYQDIRVVPDPEKDKDKLDPIVVKGIMPDHHTVIALTNAIGERFYIKRIIENPPRIGERANVVNRYWDIAGRYYDGVYPIDYHIMLSGEIIKGDEVNAPSGTTTVRLNVQGAYANKDMESIIVNLWEQLSHLIRVTLEQSSRVQPIAERDHAKFPSSLHVQNDILSSNPDGHFDRIIALRERIDDLFEMFIAGRLSEENFLRLKLETEQEIQAIQTRTQIDQKS